MPAQQLIELLEQHYQSFSSVVQIARKTGHPVPTDTRGWSQILVSAVTGIKGLERRKGADLVDGSDVKAANTWEAINSPRFNYVLKAGTQGAHSDKLTSLDAMPFLFLVLWDEKSTGERRCRIWCVRPQVDEIFRAICKDWYALRAAEKVGANFQLHPPRGKDFNVITNTCGNLIYPLLFCAERGENGYEIKVSDTAIMKRGLCRKADPTGVLEIVARPAT
jgi:hypothetical protein